MTGAGPSSGDHLDRLHEAAIATDIDLGHSRAEQITQALLEDPIRQWHDHGRPCPPHGHPRPQAPAVPASPPVGPRPDHGHHHGALQAEAPSPRPPRHRPPHKGPADEPGPQAQHPFQAQLHPRLHRRREGRRRRSPHARRPRLRERHQCLQFLHRPQGRGLDLHRRLLLRRHHPPEGRSRSATRTASPVTRRTSPSPRPTAPTRRS